MLKGFLTSCLAIAVFAVGAQIANAQHGQGCRISNAFNGMVANAYGGARCGRGVSNYEAAALWANYCNDDCSINQGCGGGCGSACGNGCGSGQFAPAADACGCGCGGHGGCLGGKFRGLFSRAGSGGCGCGCGDCFGYPSGCATGGCNSGCGATTMAAPIANCGGCDQGCGGGCNQGCGGGCGGKLKAKLAGLFSRRGRGCGCGCGLFSRGGWHDRTFSNFYARHGATTSYFGSYVGAETGFGDFTSAINGQITGCCGGAPVQSQMMPAMDQGNMQPQGMETREVSPPVLPSEVKPNHEGASYYRPSTNRVAESVLENRRGF